eukprot:CFRG0593T1
MSAPKSTSYHDYTKRINTFKQWPFPAKSSANKVAMAEAGFYHPPRTTKDNATCFRCDKNLDGWETTDDPVYEHRRGGRECFFLSMLSIANRLATFSSKWPHPIDNFGPTPYALSVCGFVYRPEYGEDYCECFMCGVGLDGWERDDVPENEHRKRNKACPCVKRLVDMVGTTNSTKTKSAVTECRGSSDSDTNIQQHTNIQTQAPPSKMGTNKTSSQGNLKSKTKGKQKGSIKSSRSASVSSRRAGKKFNVTHVTGAFATPGIDTEPASIQAHTDPHYPESIDKPAAEAQSVFEADVSRSRASGSAKRFAHQKSSSTSVPSSSTDWSGGAQIQPYEMPSISSVDTACIPPKHTLCKEHNATLVADDPHVQYKRRSSRRTTMARSTTNSSSVSSAKRSQSHGRSRSHSPIQRNTKRSVSSSQCNSQTKAHTNVKVSHVCTQIPTEAQKHGTINASQAGLTTTFDKHVQPDVEAPMPTTKARNIQTTVKSATTSTSPREENTLPMQTVSHAESTAVSDQHLHSGVETHKASEKATDTSKRTKVVPPATSQSEVDDTSPPDSHLESTVVSERNLAVNVQVEASEANKKAICMGISSSQAVCTPSSPTEEVAIHLRNSNIAQPGPQAHPKNDGHVAKATQRASSRRTTMARKSKGVSTASEGVDKHTETREAPAQPLAHTLVEGKEDIYVIEVTKRNNDTTTTDRSLTSEIEDSQTHMTVTQTHAQTCESFKQEDERKIAKRTVTASSRPTTMTADLKGKSASASPNEEQITSSEGDACDVTNSSSGRRVAMDRQSKAVCGSTKKMEEAVIQKRAQAQQIGASARNSTTMTISVSTSNSPAEQAASQTHVAISAQPTTQGQTHASSVSEKRSDVQKIAAEQPTGGCTSASLTEEEPCMLSSCTLTPRSQEKLEQADANGIEVPKRRSRRTTVMAQSKSTPTSIATNEKEPSTSRSVFPVYSTQPPLLAQSYVDVQQGHVEDATLVMGQTKLRKRKVTLTRQSESPVDAPVEDTSMHTESHIQLQLKPQPVEQTRPKAHRRPALPSEPPAEVDASAHIGSSAERLDLRSTTKLSVENLQVSTVVDVEGTESTCREGLLAVKQRKMCSRPTGSQNTTSNLLESTDMPALLPIVSNNDNELKNDDIGAKIEPTQQHSHKRPNLQPMPKPRARARLATPPRSRASTDSESEKGVAANANIRVPKLRKVSKSPSLEATCAANVPQAYVLPDASADDNRFAVDVRGVSNEVESQPTLRSRPRRSKTKTVSPTEWWVVQNTSNTLQHPNSSHENSKVMEDVKSISTELEHISPSTTMDGSSSTSISSSSTSCQAPREYENVSKLATCATADMRNSDDMSSSADILQPKTTGDQKHIKVTTGLPKRRPKTRTRPKKTCTVSAKTDTMKNADTQEDATCISEDSRNNVTELSVVSMQTNAEAESNATAIQTVKTNENVTTSAKRTSLFVANENVSQTIVGYKPAPRTKAKTRASIITTVPRAPYRPLPSVTQQIQTCTNTQQKPSVVSHPLVATCAQAIITMQTKVPVQIQTDTQSPPRRRKTRTISVGECTEVPVSVKCKTKNVQLDSPPMTTDQIACDSHVARLGSGETVGESTVCGNGTGMDDYSTPSTSTRKSARLRSTSGTCATVGVRVEANANVSGCKNLSGGMVPFAVQNSDEQLRSKSIPDTQLSAAVKQAVSPVPQPRPRNRPNVHPRPQMKAEACVGAGVKRSIPSLSEEKKNIDHRAVTASVMNCTQPTLIEIEVRNDAGVDANVGGEVDTNTTVQEPPLKKTKRGGNKNTTITEGKQSSTSCSVIDFSRDDIADSTQDLWNKSMVSDGLDMDEDVSVGMEVNDKSNGIRDKTHVHATCDDQTIPQITKTGNRCGEPVTPEPTNKHSTNIDPETNQSILSTQTSTAGQGNTRGNRVTITPTQIHSSGAQGTDENIVPNSMEQSSVLQKIQSSEIVSRQETALTPPQFAQTVADSENEPSSPSPSPCKDSNVRIPNDVSLTTVRTSLSSTFVCSPGESQGLTPHFEMNASMTVEEFLKAQCEAWIRKIHEQAERHVEEFQAEAMKVRKTYFTA